MSPLMIMFIILYGGCALAYFIAAPMEKKDIKDFYVFDLVMFPCYLIVNMIAPLWNFIVVPTWKKILELLEKRIC